MTRFYLIRHGENDVALRGAIAGRRPGIHLNDRGRQQAERVAQVLANAGIGQIFSSPMERCREMAEPLSRRVGVPVEVAEELNELDFGEWTGKSFAELETSELWRRYNRYRSITRIPGGELMLEVQQRVVGFLQLLSQRWPEEQIAVATHGDVIRAALLYYLGMPTDFVHRLGVDTGSINILDLHREGIQVQGMNWQP